MKRACHEYAASLALALAVEGKTEPSLHREPGVTGAGGMGEVYEARDPRLERHVALKIIRPEVASDPDRLARFTREAKAVAALNHPNILTVHDAGTDNGTPYVVTELLHGETLRDVVLCRSPTQRQALSWGVQTSQGLAAA
jgi:serine/threonine protein kinase